MKVVLSLRHKDKIFHEFDIEGAELAPPKIGEPYRVRHQSNVVGRTGIVREIWITPKRKTIVTDDREYLIQYKGEKDESK
jgi:hypothetical protein